MNRRLRKAILEFLTPLPAMQSPESRRAALYAAGLDAILDQVDLSGSPRDTVAAIVNALEHFGTIDDTPALVALLRYIATTVGSDKQQMIQEWCEQLLHAPSPRKSTPPEQPAASQEAAHISTQGDYFERVEGQAQVFTGPVNIYQGTTAAETTPRSASVDQPEKLWDVFVCYAKEDLDRARKLYRELREAGVKPWMAYEDILPGQDWEYEIEQALTQSRYVLALLSNNSVSRRGFIQKELTHALDVLDKLPPSTIFLIPARLDECEPLDGRLQRLHWVDLFPDYTEGLQRILRTIGSPESSEIDRVTEPLSPPTAPKSARQRKHVSTRMIFVGILMVIAIGIIIAINPDRLKKFLFPPSPKPTPTNTSTTPTPTPKSPTPEPLTPIASSVLHLRSEPKTVSTEDAQKEFELTTRQTEWGVTNWAPRTYIENQYEVQGEVVVDHATGLMWQKLGSENDMTYGEAQEYVKRQNQEQFAGYDDWRLPTIPELMSLLEPEKQANNLYIDPISFDTPKGWYSKGYWVWSADLHGSSGAAWGVNFRYGYVHWPDLLDRNYARCVRAQTSLDNTIWWDGVYHDQSGTYMNPLFPTAVQDLTLFLRVNRNDISHARIRYWNGQEHYVDMIWDRADEGYDYWKGMIPASSTQVYYRFELFDGQDVDWYDAGGMSDDAKEEGDFTYFPVGGTPFYQTPDWVKQAVFYQIFPERFYNGDATNDPPGTEAWGSEPKTDTFLGGDLAGILQKLDYLNDGDPDTSTDLGITALYLNPIFESSTNHKYSTEDYERVDDNFGDNTLLTTLIAEAHQRGIRVVLDGVFNHTGVAHPFFDDVIEKGTASPYYDYYQIYRWPIHWYDDLNGNGRQDGNEPDFAHWSGTTNDEFLRTNDYDAWWGFAHLPNLMTEHPAIRDYFIHDADAIAVRWLNMGIDGWRLDVANEIEDEFWQAFRDRVKAVNSDAYIVGEYWGNAAKWLNGTMWDSTMNYRFRNAVQNFFAGQDDAGNPSQTTVEEFDRALYGIQSDYSTAAYSTALNLLDSHDTWRFMDRCNGDWEKFRAAVLFQMTYTGVPMVYYGDENGMSQWPNAKRDPGNRSAMEWTTYTHPQQRQINEFYRTLIRLRLSHPALRSPHVRAMYRNNADSVYAYARRSETETLLVVINNSDASQRAEFEIHGLFLEGTTLKDLLSGGQYTVSAGKVRIENLPKRSGLILTPNVPPTADFRVTPARPKRSETISFDGADSSDPDGVIVRYEWDWDNDGTYDTDGSNVSTRFEVAGTYPVTLRVTDDTGETGTVTKQISVKPDGDGTGEDVYGTTHAFAEENIYFVLTDRFVNGNSSNDHRDQGQHSGRPTWELRMDGPDGQYANIGYMGGDFEGLYQQADYIKEMGFSAIWITPIVDNPDESFSGGQPCFFGADIGSEGGKTGYHGYWGVNFYEVDEHLESPGFSFAEFTAKMKHDHDLDIILDIVCNHGSPSFSMTPEDQPKFGEIYNQEGIKVADHENKFPHELDHANPLHQFYNKGGGLLQRSDLNEHHPPVLDYLTGAYLHWIEQGVAAFRIDTIAWMPHSFWKAFADRIRGAHPDFFMFGEDFNYSAHDIAQHQKAENGGISVLDFPCKEAINVAFRPGGSYRSLEECLHLTDGVYTNPYELVTFYDNHDMPRMGTDDQGFIDAHNWLFTARGIPCIYYGSENRFMAGKSEHQGNRNYYGTDRIQEARNSEIFQRLKTIATIRKNSVALQKGVQVNLFLSDNTAAFYRVFQHGGENQTALVLLNKRTNEIPFEITEYLSHGMWVDAETDDVYEVTSNRLTTSVPAHDVKVLLFNGPVNHAGFMTHLQAIMASRGEKSRLTRSLR